MTKMQQINFSNMSIEKGQEIFDSVLEVLSGKNITFIDGMHVMAMVFCALFDKSPPLAKDFAKEVLVEHINFRVDESFKPVKRKFDA